MNDLINKEICDMTENEVRYELELRRESFKRYKAMDEYKNNRLFDLENGYNPKIEQLNKNNLFLENEVKNLKSIIEKLMNRNLFSRIFNLWG